MYRFDLDAIISRLYLVMVYALRRERLVHRTFEECRRPAGADDDAPRVALQVSTPLGGFLMLLWSSRRTCRKLGIVTLLNEDRQCGRCQWLASTVGTPDVPDRGP